MDENAAPKQVDWTDAIGPDAGKTLKAIYELKGDRFVFIAAAPGAPRPTRFHTRQGETLRRFLRKTPAR